MNEFNALMLGAGGLGLFLLGMVLMTDSLKKLAGDRLRSVLFEFTKTPSTGALSGALATAVVQSSSATTLAAVGFVGAGLMSFSNALGIIFGANIGTTITGWMVALLGFKFSIGSIASLLVLGGILLKLFARYPWSQTGMALAGFGLLFVGIDTLQTAMAGLVDVVNFSQLPANNLTGLLKLMLIGLVFTTITQSSSAGVALTLTALFNGLIEFEQAAALVIGMDVGTTIKSLMAVIGGNVGARRTGLSHVVYNLITAVFALLLITPYTQAVNALSPSALTDNAEIALVGFHSLFNLLGVILILPFTEQFARLIKRLIPETRSAHTRRLETGLLAEPELALNAIQSTLMDLHNALLKELRQLMQQPTAPTFGRQLPQLQQELDETRNYIDHIHLIHSSTQQWKRLISMIHTLDHLQRLHERCEEEGDRAEASKRFPILSKFTLRLTSDLEALQQAIRENKWHEAVKLARTLHHFLQQDSEGYRHKLVQQMGEGKLDAEQWRDALEAIRWMQRVSKHLYRISYHMEKMLLASGK
ncbi:Na/Pi symporter [Thiomicrorhabdus sp. zzn3]|uniref:Na/Pi cotransporter family protein n=1 Tax=Thiomicrorhabdus sp. zzn3 TaxID=3039775 RepID=UPI0024368C8B|nr:Na/Pi symporter [Thiomicrorhabdus sp. zzn3]MDG6778726.1 Na/Pi symporter [Thiomicrorhabdus sp. zzn3]